MGHNDRQWHTGTLRENSVNTQKRQDTGNTQGAYQGKIEHNIKDILYTGT